MNQDINSQFKQLVYTRLQALPDDMEISIGNNVNLTKAELLEHVAKGDEIGQQMIAVEKEFFQMIKDGSLYDLLAE